MDTHQQSNHERAKSLLRQAAKLAYDAKHGGKSPVADTFEDREEHELRALTVVTAEQAFRWGWRRRPDFVKASDAAGHHFAVALIAAIGAEHNDMVEPLAELRELGRLPGILSPMDLAAAERELPHYQPPPPPAPQYPEPDAELVKVSRRVNSALVRDSKAKGWTFGYVGVDGTIALAEVSVHAPVPAGKTRREMVADCLDSLIDRGAKLAWMPSEEQPQPPIVAGGCWVNAGSHATRNLIPAQACVLELAE